MKRCMYCGNENDDSSVTCSKCGNRLLDMPEQEVMPAEEVPEGMVEEQQSQEPEISDIQTPEFEESQQVEANDLSMQMDPASAPQDIPYPNAQEAYPYGAQGGFPQNGYEQPYGQQPYAGPNVQQQYGGQAYGYQQPAQQYGYSPAQEEGARDYGQRQMMGGGKQLLMKSRSMVKSPLFFLVALLYTGMIGLTVANAVMGNTVQSINDIRWTIEQTLGFSADLKMLTSFLNGILGGIERINPLYLMGAALAAALPTLLICLGMWMMFFKTSKKREVISTSGYTLVKVMEVLKFIMTCLVFLAILILNVAFVVAAGASSSTIAVIAGVIFLIIFIIISVLFILYYVQMFHALKVIKLNARTGADPGRIALFLPVIALIMAVLSGLVMLPMSPDDIFGLAQQGTTAGFYLFISIWAFAYRAKVR